MYNHFLLRYFAIHIQQLYLEISCTFYIYHNI
jgi:hypothetical protein